MIYALKYLTHPLEKVNQVVYDFLKNSIPTAVYSRALFPEWFRAVLQNSKAKPGQLSLEQKFQLVHAEIQALTEINRTKLFNEFLNGIDILSLCEDKTKPVVDTRSYSLTLHDALNSLLKDHFYGTTLGSNKTLKTQLDTSLKDHYLAFKKLNNSGRVCPFCGLHEYAVSDGESKDDYDHWLYKAKYPLYAINFSNLVPMCGSCNDGSVKGTDDVIFNTDTGNRRESFYPYFPHSGIRLVINSYTSINDIAEEEIRKKYPFGKFTIQIEGISHDDSEKIETWKDVFNIQSRFESYISAGYIELKDDFHDIYLPDHPEFVLSNDLDNLRTIVIRFRDQLGNEKRKTGVSIMKVYLDYICLLPNSHLLATFCNINLIEL